MLRKFLGSTHWTQRIREATVSRDEEGSPNLRLQGGAEYGQLLYLGGLPERGTARSQSGRPQAGDLLLEVNEAPVSGLTLRDALDLLAGIEGPIRIKTVPQGSHLNTDLRHFLRQSFSQGSADTELQECIRQNLYIRAVPCTTRAPREGEVPGTDYHFISLSEFHALDRAGGLLESGKFNGNYYGTPVPPMVPTDRTLTLDLSVLRYPQRSKSLVNLEKDSGREEAHLGRAEAQAETRAAGGGGGHETDPTGSLPAGREGRSGRVSASTESGTESQELPGANVPDPPPAPDPSQLLGHSVFTTVAKTNHTFGFTIAGGNRRSELLQIVSVAPGGPADRNADLRIYDVLVAIDGASVLGSTHSQVVRIFQSVPEGEGVALHLRRGYPALYEVEPTLLSQVNARAASAGVPGPPLALLRLPILQSRGGPGFSVSRGAGGQVRVAGVSDRRSCPGLAQGDVLLQVNGQKLRGLSDRQLEQVLRDHTRGGDTILLVQRAVPDAVNGPSPDSVRCSAEGTSQIPAGIPEAGGEEGGGGEEGVPQLGPGGGWPSGLETPGEGTAQGADARLTLRDPPSRRDDEGSQILNSSPDTGTWDEASTDASGKQDARDGDGRAWSRAAAWGSSGQHLSLVRPSQDLEFYTVILERGTTGFGFSVRGGSEYEMDLYVLGLMAGGPAMNSGKIRVGDQLVEINGEHTLGMTHSQAVELIKQAPGTLHLLMRCGNGQVPEYGPEMMGETAPRSDSELPIQYQLLSLILNASSELQRSLRDSPPPTLPSPRRRGGAAASTRSRAAGEDGGSDCSRAHRRSSRGGQAGRPGTGVFPEGRALQPGRGDGAWDGTDCSARVELPESRPESPDNPTGPQGLANRSRPKAQTRPESPDNPTGHQGLAKRSRPEARTRSEAPDNLTGTRGLDKISRPKAPDNPSGPQGLDKISRPKAPDNPTGPQDLDKNSRPAAWARPEAWEAHDRPEACEDSSETTSEGSDDCAGCSDAPGLSRFDEQRMLNSLVGGGLGTVEAPPLAGRSRGKAAPCPHCDGRRAARRRLRPVLAPGPWKVPARERLLQIVEG